jgi:hypothetical protein
MTNASNGCRDFDFLHGRWSVHHQRLSERGQGSKDWQQFSGTAETRPLLDGVANIEEHCIEGVDVSGAALRIFDPSTGRWSIYWVSARRAVLEPPVVGSFDGAIGRFEAEDLDGDRSVRVQFLWDRTDLDEPRWEQSFSYDEGGSWELNWTMQFDRIR